jgi:hypothetical protein
MEVSSVCCSVVVIGSVALYSPVVVALYSCANRAATVREPIAPGSGTARLT